MNYLTLILTVLLAGCAPQRFIGGDPGAELRPFVNSFYTAYGGPHEQVEYAMVPLDGPAALCTRGDNGVKIITVDLAGWDTLCEQQKKSLVWHELGHCILNRAHVDGNTVSHMTPKLVGNCDYYTDEIMAEMDLELFE